MLDSDLAQVYAVPTKRLNEQVRRNPKRFPSDFAFRLTEDEVEILRSQFATSSWGGRRYLPLVFTEHGVVMLAHVLNSKVAVEASVLVVRAFITHPLDPGNACRARPKGGGAGTKYDAQFRVVFDAIRELMAGTEATPRDKIGFRRSSSAPAS